jgi:hypothetical protein
MSVSQLRDFLDMRGVDHSKCIEKSEIHALALECAAAPTAAHH